MRKPWAPIFELPWVYRAWQAPFAERKLAPLKRHNDLSAVRSVLDVGCGPGTNAPHFRGLDYLGLDINPEYVSRARERYGMRFEVADVTRWEARDGAFDLILVNSFFHHVDDEASDRILGHLATLLTEDGRVHVLDLVLPDAPSPARLLARMDRGDHPRPLAAWRRLLGARFEEEVFEPYDLGVPGVPLWKMVYFRGRARNA
ncbi:MAG TPA: class I SAM-dependent methyltransferase [Longimicrobiales bacterium]|nr:class I SAM-dependent methyltransferase [Longimicrobiales bacterium]